MVASGETDCGLARHNPLNALQPLIHGLLYLDDCVGRSSPFREKPLRTAPSTAVTPFTRLERAGHRVRLLRGEGAMPLPEQVVIRLPTRRSR